QARQRVYSEILSIDPDDPVVHGLRDEQKREDGTWVLRETLAAKERRTAIRSLAAAAIAAVAPPQKCEPTAEETELGVHWSRCLATGAVRVLTTGEEAEAQRVAQLTQAAAPFLSQVFEMAIEIQPGWTSYLLANQGEHLPFLEHHPAINSSFREFL